MAVSKHNLLEKAVEITKEYASSGSTSPSVDIVLQRVYEKLKELNEDIRSED